MRGRQQQQGAAAAANRALSKYIPPGTYGVSSSVSLRGATSAVGRLGCGRQRGPGSMGGRLAAGAMSSGRKKGSPLLCAPLSLTAGAPVRR